MGDVSVAWAIASVATILAVRHVAWLTRVASSSMVPTFRPALYAIFFLIR